MPKQYGVDVCFAGNGGCDCLSHLSLAGLGCSFGNLTRFRFRAFPSTSVRHPREISLGRKPSFQTKVAQEATFADLHYGT